MPRLKWEANLTCYKRGNKGHLAREFPVTGNAVVSSPSQNKCPTTSQTNPTGTTLLTATNPTLYQTITPENSSSAELQ